MKKKNKIIILSSLVITTILSLPIITLINGFLLSPVFDKTYLGELKEKIKLLKETDGKRIVFIGGSALPFGIDSSLIQDNIKEYKVIDFGMYASLGSNVMLDLSKDFIHKDDIVIFSPEIDTQTLSMYYNGESLWQALDGDFSSLSLLSSSTRERLFGDFYHFSNQKFKYTFLNEMNLEGIYQKSSFDEYGDIKRDLRPYNVMYNMTGVNKISFDTSIITDEFITYVNSYAKSVKDKGAKMYFSFVPMNELAIEDESSIDTFYDYIDERFEFDILGNPHSSIMDKEWFYDTDFHLNGSGTIVYSREMIRNIKLILNDRTPTDIPQPLKPKVPDKVDDTDGNNIDSEYFSYTMTDKGYMITSLVKEKESVVIPYRFNDSLVIGFTPTTFENKSEIKEITIQANVKRIFDNSFSGCSKLEKIRFINPSPSSIIIGKDLLNGTDANIYVPKEYVSRYITDYTFSQYADRIKPE